MIRFIKNLGFVFLLIFLASSLIRNILDYQKKSNFIDKFRSLIEEEKNKKLSLKTKILIKSDPYEIEKKLRNKLNLSRANEAVIILPQPTPTPTKKPAVAVPNWQQWWKIFFY